MLKSVEFWVAVAVAIIVKIKTSARLGPVAVVTTVMVAVGAAYVGSEYAAQLTGVPEPVAAGLVWLVRLEARGLLNDRFISDVIWGNVDLSADANGDLLDVILEYCRNVLAMDV